MRTLRCCWLSFVLGACAGAPAAAHAIAAPELQRSDAAPRLPQEGDRIVSARVYYGIPILQRSFFWDGNGEVDTAGLKTRCLWFTSPNTALGAGLTLNNWFVGGNDVQTAEAEGVGRFYVHRGETWALFAEVTGGYSQSTDAIPPGGTEWNFTFSFGPGVDVPVGDGLDFITGVTYHHTSNALGHQNPRNPSQNEAQLWVGMDWRF